jgi:hypothetical protein
VILPIEKVRVKILLDAAKWRKDFMCLPIDVGMQCHQIFVLCPTLRHKELAIWRFLVKRAPVGIVNKPLSGTI